MKRHYPLVILEASWDTHYILYEFSKWVTKDSVVARRQTPSLTPTGTVLVTRELLIPTCDTSELWNQIFQESGTSSSSGSSSSAIFSKCSVELKAEVREIGLL